MHIHLSWSNCLASLSMPNAWPGDRSRGVPAPRDNVGRNTRPDTNSAFTKLSRCIGLAGKFRRPANALLNARGTSGIAPRSTYCFTLIYCYGPVSISAGLRPSLSTGRGCWVERHGDGRFRHRLNFSCLICISVLFESDPLNTASRAQFFEHLASLALHWYQLSAMTGLQ